MLHIPLSLNMPSLLLADLNMLIFLMKNFKMNLGKLGDLLQSQSLVSSCFRLCSSGKSVCQPCEVALFCFIPHGVALPLAKDTVVSSSVSELQLNVNEENHYNYFKSQ